MWLRVAVAGLALGFGAGEGLGGQWQDLHEAPLGRSRRVTSANVDPTSNVDHRVVAAGAELTLADLRGPGIITRCWLTIDSVDPHFARLLVVRAKWDGESSPSVEVPLGDFFGVGHGLLRSVVSETVRVAGDGRAFSCFWPMPFAESAQLLLRNDSQYPIRVLAYQIDWRELDEPPPELRTFHASYRQGLAPPGQEYVVADLRGRGHYVGTVLSIRSGEAGWPGEGDDRFYIDDAETASLRGTGTEDYFGEAWSFRKNQGPYSGVTVFEGTGAGARCSAYRWHLADSVPFERALRMTFETLGWAVRGDRWLEVNDRPDFFSSVAFWYQEEPHLVFPPLAAAAERLGYAERRHELEIAAEHCEVPHGQPPPQRQEGRFFAFGGQLVWEPSQLSSARFGFGFEQEQDGEVDLVLRYSTAPSFGVYEVILDGQPLRIRWDGYADRILLRELFLGRRMLEKGTHRLEFRGVGQNPLATGWGLGVDSVMLRW